jgi:hypothetical protein
MSACPPPVPSTYPPIRAARCISSAVTTTVLSISHIRDGTTNTLLVGEHATKSPVGRRTFWARSFAAFNKSSVKADSRTLVGDFQTCIDLGGGQACKRGWGSFHPGGLHFAIADGSVRFIGDTVDMNLLADLATIAGNEIAQLP